MDTIVICAMISTIICAIFIIIFMMPYFNHKYCDNILYRQTCNTIKTGIKPYCNSKSELCEYILN